MARLASFRKVFGAAFLLAALVMFANPSTSIIGNWVGPRAAQAESLTFTVNSTADDFDDFGGNGICATSTGACTLRAAITEANKHAGPDTIAFNIPGSGVQTIQLNSTLPNLSDTTGPTTIDGYTQPGSSPNSDPLVSNATIMVQIAGPGSAGFDALKIISSNNQVRGLAFYNLRRSIQLTGSGANDNVIVGNFIGTDATGTSSAPASAASASGVDIREGASTNQIGGTSPAERNVISGSALNGIGIYHQTTHANVIQNNLIGLSPGGDRRVPNRRQGIDINNDSYANVVGGNGPGEHNVISGNSGAAVELSHGRANSENQVIGNFIGTDVTGNSGSAYTHNIEFGIHLEDGVTNNTFAENVIGNNDKGGVRIEGFFTEDNHFHDNRIGISLDGTPIPNHNAGIQIENHALRSQIGPNNVIAYNTTGVSVAEDDVDSHTITRNSIFGNTQLGIDLQPLGGRNANDLDDADSGPNEQLNFPTLTSATSDKVSGTACAESVVPKPCTVEVFLSDGVAAEYGEGKTFVGSSTTNPDGTFTVAVRGVSDGAYVTATATDATGNASEFSLNRVVKKTPPAAPSNLTATAISSSKIDLSWTDNATDETAYTVERSLDGSTGWVTLSSTLPVDTTSFTNNTLKPETIYYYRVKATNANGSSDYSNIAHATTMAVPPAAPSGLTATAVSSSKIDLKWTDNATDETAYTVERSLDGSTGWTELTSTLAAGTTGYSDTNLQPGTTYYYRVKATNSAGSSPYSNVANATTNASSQPPLDPSGLRATVVSSSRIDLQWTDNATNESAYTVERSLNGSTNWTEVTSTLPADTTTYSDTGLNGDTTYYYRVKATNADGGSGYSNTASATTGLSTPSNLTATAASASQIDLSWKDNSTSETAYTVERSLDGGANWTALTSTLPTDTTTYSDTGLSAGTIYHYRVKATNSNGSSDYSNVASATASANVFSDNWSGTDSAAWDASKWTTNVGTSASVDILSNQGRMRFENVSNARALAIASMPNRTNTEVLMSFTTPSIEAKGFLQIFSRASGNWVSGYPGSGYFVEIQNNSSSVGLSKVSSGTITQLSNAAAVGQATTTKQWVRLRVEGSTLQAKVWTDGTPEPASWEIQATDSSFSEPGVLQLRWARASTATGAREVLLDDLTVRDLDSNSLLPADPSGLTATAASTSKIDLQWTDNATNESAYTVERSLNGSTNWTEVTSTLPADTTTYSDTGLSAGTTYYYRVKATNSAGSSKYTNTANASTSADTNVFSESWTGGDGGPWDASKWTTNVGTSASVDILSNQGRMRFENVSNARALAIASMPNRTNTEVLMSFTTPSIEAKGFLQIFSRASGNWVSGYPGSGYFVEIQNNSSSVGLSKVSSGTVTQLSNAAIGRATTTKQWVRFRIEGSTLKVKVWTDGTQEPSAWEMEATDSSFSQPGVLQLRWARASTATAAREVHLDDLTITDLSP